jgi:hypothetical protein
MIKSARYLVAAVILLGGLIYWDDYQVKKEEGLKKTQNLLLDGKHLRDVKSITYYDKNADSFDGSKEIEVKAVKNELGWDLKSPVNEPADVKTIDNLLKTLIEYKYEKSLKVLSDFKKFGLERPQRKITLEFYDGNSIDLEIGENAPIGYSVYTRISNKKDLVFIGSQHINTATVKSLFDFRVKEVRGVSFDTLESISVSASNVKNPFKHRMIKDSEGWKGKSKSLSEELDESEVKDLITAISRLVVKKFLDQNDFSEAVLKSSPRLDVEVKLSSVETRGFEFLKIAEKVYFHDRSIYKEVTDSFAKYFDKDILGYKNKKLVELKASKVTKVRLNDFSFVKKEGRWQNDNKTEIESVELENFLYDLEFSKVKSFSKELNILGKRRLIVEVEIEGLKNQKIEVFESKKSRDEFLVTSSSYSGAGKVSKDLFSKIIEKL